MRFSLTLLVKPHLGKSENHHVLIHKNVITVKGYCKTISDLKVSQYSVFVKYSNVYLDGILKQ